MKIERFRRGDLVRMLSRRICAGSHIGVVVSVDLESNQVIGDWFFLKEIETAPLRCHDPVTDICRYTRSQATLLRLAYPQLRVQGES